MSFAIYFLLKHMFMKYMVFGFYRFLKVAVIGKTLLQSSWLMKTVAVKEAVVAIITLPKVL